MSALRRLGHEAELWEDRDDPFGRPSERALRLDPTDAHATLAAIREAAERFGPVDPRSS